MDLEQSILQQRDHSTHSSTFRWLMCPVNILHFCSFCSFPDTAMPAAQSHQMRTAVQFLWCNHPHLGCLLCWQLHMPPSILRNPSACQRLPELCGRSPWQPRPQGEPSPSPTTRLVLALLCWSSPVQPEYRTSTSLLFSLPTHLPLRPGPRT